MLTPRTPASSFTKEDNPWLAKRPLKTNGRLANLGLTSLVKEATGCKYITEIQYKWHRNVNKNRNKKLANHL